MNNFIIDFTPEIESYRKDNLTKKLLSKGEFVNYIRIDQKNVDEGLPEEQIKLLNQINSLSRIYILDHGTPNSQKIRSGHYQDIADIIGQNIKSQDEILYSPNSKLKISLIPCYSGKGDNSGLESFAGLFHRYLGQNYHIYSEVLARNELVWTLEEKFTASTLNYIIFSIAQELGITKSPVSAENILKHQTPGTKISLQWDKNGEEWIVDAYIDKYFIQISKIIQDVENNIQLYQLKEKNKIQLVDLINSLKILIQEKINETYASVKVMDQVLIKIKDILKNQNALANEFIEEALKLSNHSINEKSILPKHSPINISFPAKEKEENIKQKINEQLISPITCLLDQLPNTPQAQTLKKEVTEFLQHLSSVATLKLKREQNFKPERNINRYMEKILLHLILPEVSKEKKIHYIMEIKNAMGEELTDEIFGWPEMTGGLEGFQAAVKAGGWIGLKNLLPLMAKRSQEKTKDLKTFSAKLNSLIECSLRYAEISDENIHPSILSNNIPYSSPKLIDTKSSNSLDDSLESNHSKTHKETIVENDNIAT